MGASPRRVYMALSATLELSKPPPNQDLHLTVFHLGRRNHLETELRLKEWEALTLERRTVQIFDRFGPSLIGPHRVPINAIVPVANGRLAYAVELPEPWVATRRRMVHHIRNLLSELGGTQLIGLAEASPSMRHGLSNDWLPHITIPLAPHGAELGVARFARLH